MPVTDSFVRFVLEQLNSVGPITPKRMFGGVGLYAGDLFFALIAGDLLYLKVDDSMRGELEAVGARPFQPYPDRGKGKMRYYSVPAEILEDSDELIAWVAKAHPPPWVAEAFTQRRLGSRSKAPSRAVVSKNRDTLP